MYISDRDKERILEASKERLVDVIKDYTPLHKHGASFAGKCPCCSDEKGLNVTPGKGVFKCFKCNQLAGKTPLDYLMKGQNMTFPEALEKLAIKCNIFIEAKPKRPKQPTVKLKKLRGEDKVPYYKRMLAESGLAEDDVRLTVYDKENDKILPEKPTFGKGSFNQLGDIDRSVDDVIIEYFDLDGMPVRYVAKDSKGRETGKMKEYCRVRFQFPDEHKDKSGKPAKYKSPFGSGTFIYIPDRLRQKYRRGEKIERLFIQEGEKKAEKACKHGLDSIAISGIQNLGQGGRVPEDLIKVIQVCNVKEVCFLLDADWNDLSSEIRINDSVEKRPRNFFYAVRSYKEYIRSLKNRDLYLEIYFGYVRKNEKDDKGVDDLLANTLQGKEDELKADIDFLINEKNLSGTYVQLHKITTWTDNKLEEVWSLNSPKIFAQTHMAILKDMPEFRIGRHVWRINAKGEIESAQPIESDEQFWTETERCNKAGDIYKVFEFRYVRSHKFLHNRGIGRHMLLDGTFEYIHLQPPFVRSIESWEVRDFVFEFARVNCKEDVNEMLLKGGTQYLGPDKLSSLPFITPNFKPASREKQMFYFKDKCWEVTARGVTELNYTDISYHIWQDQKKDFPAKALPDLIHWKSTDSGYEYSLTQTGQKCDFLRFLINSSNFTWRKEMLQKENAGDKPDTEVTDQEISENRQHLLAKLCAIGYMVMTAKDENEGRIVVAMDGRQSEVGVSNGRSGKSLVGKAFQNIQNTVYINGKKPDMQTDQFLWNDVTEKTRSVFIDDVRPGFNIEFLFPNTTGDWLVNYKGGRRCTLPFSISPKMYVTTNHAMNGEGGSFKARQWLIAFSDYYSDTHSPKDDFGSLFFSEWDFEQWNLFWNLIAQCVKLYLQYGVVQAPGERLELRQLRQSIGENFILWADAFFSQKDNMNRRIPRIDLATAYYKEFPTDQKFVNASLFKKRFKNYAKFKGFEFNPQKYDQVTGKPVSFDKDGRPDTDDKSGGVEYFTLGDDKFWNTKFSGNMNLPFDEPEEKERHF